MEVINPRAALLSNYEVLSLLRELEHDHLSRAKTALRVKKEEEAGGLNASSTGKDSRTLEISENLRTVEVEAIQYLTADYLPTHSQTHVGITQLVAGLAGFELTKAEKLQIVNLSPTLPVELYVIVEELEDRLGPQMEDILSCVQSSLTPLAKLDSGSSGPVESSLDIVHSGVQDMYPEDVYDEDADADHDDMMFDDTGEGAGVEGDLDLEDD